MRKIQLEIHGFTGDVGQLLAEPSSGFKANEVDQGYDFRRPLQSEVGDVVTIAGIIINVAQLAMSLFDILQSKRNSASPSPQKDSVSIYVKTDEGIIKLSGDDVEQIRSILEEISDDR
jgi:hypothetical protein